MSWTNPKTWIAAILTAADMNTHLRDNLNELRGGGLAISGQATGRLPYASSSSQLATDAQYTVDTLVRVLNRDVIEAEVVNTTSETTIYSFSVPANTLGTNRMLRLTILADLLNASGSTDNWVVRLKFGATTLIVTTMTAGSVASNRRAVIIRAYISARNSAADQQSVLEIVQSNANNSEGNGDPLTEPRLGFKTSTLDTTGALTLEVTLQHSVADASTSFRARTIQLELV